MINGIFNPTRPPTVIPTILFVKHFYCQHPAIPTYPRYPNPIVALGGHNPSGMGSMPIVILWKIVIVNKIIPPNDFFCQVRVR